MSFFTGLKAIEPSTSGIIDQYDYTRTGKGQGKGRRGVLPNKVVNDSAASRNSVVETALSFSLLTGTSVKDLLTVSRKVPPGG